MLLVAGVVLSPADMAPLQLGACGGAVEIVKELKYSGSLVEETGRMTGFLTIALCRLLRLLTVFVVLYLWFITSVWR